VIHPATVLFDGRKTPAALPVCDHYAGSQVLLEKSLVLQDKLSQQGKATFDITADCEDGAPVGAEREHANMIGDLIASSSNKFNRVGMRIHDPSHANWHTDLEVALPKCGHNIAYIVIPKPTNADQVNRVISAIDDVTFQSGVRRQIPVHVLIETHGAMNEVDTITSIDRVECVSFGLLDYISEFNGALPSSVMQSPGQFENPVIRRAKLNISLACHSHGKVPSHGVTTDIENPAQAGKDATRAGHDFGFTRMWSIHPLQIAPIISALSPGFDEISLACEVLFAAQAVDWAPVQVAGRLQDRASFRYWWLLLRRAHLAGVHLPAKANAWFDPR
jgi:citrate lyase subunit beta / citryl-CoA lyase